MVDPSTAMFFALAESRLTAPSTLRMTWLLLVSVSDLDSVSLVARLLEEFDELVSVSLTL
jgi:hypothetical protein